MRAAIRALPDGTYENTIRTDGLTEPLDLKVALTIQGDEVTADFAGSAPQVDKAINCAMCYTYAMTAYAVKCAAAPNLPNNDGSIRPIKAVAPEGCILNPQFPASGGSRALIGHFVPSLIFGALAKVIPEKIMAGAGSPLWCINQSGVTESGAPFAKLFFFNGGMGGTNQADGQSTLSWPSNISTTPIEVIEQLAPLRVHRRRLRPGSGGSGKFRGGLGQEVHFESVSKTPTAVAFLAERTRVAAPGIAGGEAGAKGELRINGELADPKQQHIIRTGDTITLCTPGGGGYGLADERDGAATERDRAEGKLAE